MKLTIMLFAISIACIIAMLVCMISSWDDTFWYFFFGALAFAWLAPIAHSIQSDIIELRQIDKLIKEQEQPFTK